MSDTWDGPKRIHIRMLSAFEREYPGWHDVKLDPDGTITVWDDLARHYTPCHAISRTDQERIREYARTMPPACEFGYMD